MEGLTLALALRHHVLRTNAIGGATVRSSGEAPFPRGDGDRFPRDGAGPCVLRSEVTADWQTGRSPFLTQGQLTVLKRDARATQRDAYLCVAPIGSSCYRSRLTLTATGPWCEFTLCVHREYRKDLIIICKDIRYELLGQL
jgi:hypothetical protein